MGKKSRKPKKQIKLNWGHKFCTVCGQLLEDQFSYFDPHTGEPVMKKVCLTYGCPRNEICRTFYDHKFGFWPMGTCKRCGRYLSCD